jgi:hypothetical protein
MSFLSNTSARRGNLKIGVISDTHVRSFAELPQNLLTILAKVDLIIHAGDITTIDVIRGLERLAPVKGVYGNMDLPEVRVVFPQQQVIEVEGRKIGIVHGNGGPWMIEERVMQVFPDVDAIIFGHSHEAFNNIIDGTLLFNPGRASQSYGLLEVGKKIESKIFEGYY